MPAATTPNISPSAGGPKKFSTIAGLGSKGSEGTLGSFQPGRQSVKGLFDEPSQPLDEVETGIIAPKARTAAQVALGPSNESGGALSRSHDGPWSVSVAEAKDKRDGRKKAKGHVAYVLYVTTPTHNITLTRSAADIVELDHKLREGQSSASTLPILPRLPSSKETSSRRILATISRTLSPSGIRNKPTMGMTLSPPGLGASDRSSSTSPSSSPSAAPEASQEFSSPQPTTTQLATYFTVLSNLPFIKRHKAWKRFTKIGSDDLQSVRVERRVRKVRSDLAQHVKSSVAPTNTNVGVSPSQSDLDEDNGKTDDEREVRSNKSRASQSRDPATAHFSSAKDGEKSVEEASSRSAAGESNESSTVEADRAPRTPQKHSVDQVPKRKSTVSTSEEHDQGTDPDSSAAALTQSSRRPRRNKDKVTVDDFEMIRVLGKGCAGKVLLVRHRASRGLFAMKSIHKRHVLAHQELQHTLTEQAVLKRMAKEVQDPFVVRLWWSFHDVSNLYLVMDFHPGGDLATQLSRWGRLGRDRARFYAAEIVEGVEGLHRAGVIYRDLKPENVLIGGDGHIILSDFGLSKEFPARGGGGSATPPPGSPGLSRSSRDVPMTKSRSTHWLSASEDGCNVRSASRRWADDRDMTSTFCGTAEYLAPEVIQGAAYSYEVDWWSFGTMLYEMLTGITPFWAETHADMYVRVLNDELVFPEERVLDVDTKSILRGLLQKNPAFRMKEPRIKKHPYFSMIEWDHVFHKRYIPPYVPPIDPENEIDTQNFDETFLDMQPTVTNLPDDATEEMIATAEGERLKNMDSLGGANVSCGKTESNDQSHLFDGYSFRGRRDSESAKSVKSSIMSLVEPGPSESASGDRTTETIQAHEIDDDDEDDSAARAAVAALDHLEREAAAAEAIGDLSRDTAVGADTSMSNSTPSAQSVSTRATSAAVSRDGNASESDHSHSAARSPKSPSGSFSKPSARFNPSAGGLPANGAIAENENEDEDWDMVELDGAEGVIKSEINGGRGTNLFARGVVDTYRLLRRQESSRIPNSTSFGSTASRPFNRLGKRRTTGAPLAMHNKVSNGNLTSASAASLESNARSLGHASTDEVHTPANLDVVAEDAHQPEHERAPTLTAPVSNPNGLDRKKAGSPSFAGSDENKQQVRIKKIKRFTTFFETVSHR